MKSLSGKLGVVLVGLAIFGNAEVWGAESTPRPPINFEPLIYTLLGWVLGVLGTLILERLKRRRVKKDFLKSVCVQFKEVVPRLAGTYFTLKRNLGEMDRDVLNWIRSVTSQGYQFLEDKEDKTVEAMDKLLELDDEQIIGLNQLTKQKPPKASLLGKFSVPLLEENISSILLLDSKLQHSLLDIRAKVNWLNELVAQHNSFFEKTFDSGINDENWDRLDSNIRTGYGRVGNWCRRISELIMEMVIKCQPHKKRRWLKWQSTKGEGTGTSISLFTVSGFGR